MDGELQETNVEQATGGLVPAGDNDLEAAARFESNRRYDHRPATENVNRPPLVLTTRREETQKRRANIQAGAFRAAAILTALGAGVLIGWRFQSGDEAPAEPDQSAASETSAPIPASPSASANDSNTDLGKPAAAVESAAQGSITTESTATESTGAEPGQAGQFDLLGEAQFLADSKTLELDRLVFVPGETSLTEEGQAELGSLVELLLAHPLQPVELRVRTYSESTPGSNHGLSVHQANTLTTMLTSAGVDRARMTAVGLGSLDAELPNASGALFFEAPEGVLPERLAGKKPLIFEQPFDGSFDPDSEELLRAVSSIKGDESVSIVAYSWSADSADANHDLSHGLIDAAAALLAESGIPAEQISGVGLGDAAVTLSDRTTEVTMEVGATAEVAVLFGSVPVDAVSFESDGSGLTDSGKDTLDAVAQVLAENPDIEVEIAVHSYGAATTQRNHDLSKAQAEAVGAYLQRAGITDDQVRLMAHGDPHHFAEPGRESVVTFTVIR